jgi:hypothetical protein
MDKIFKQPNETFYITFSAEDVLQDGDGISITGTSIKAYSGDTDVTDSIIDADSIIYTATSVAAKVKNGESGSNYKITALLATTVAEEVYEIDMLLVVRDY